MASHGRSGIAAVVLGSVTNKVLTHTNVSSITKVVCRGSKGFLKFAVALQCGDS